MEQLTGTLSGAPATRDYEKLCNKPQINGMELTGNQNFEDLGMDEAFVTSEELEQALAGKADQAVVNQALALKADAATVNQALAGKADQSAVEQALAGKADQEAVNQALAAKADTVTMNQALAGKANETEFQQLKSRVDALVDGNEVSF